MKAINSLHIMRESIILMLLIMSTGLNVLGQKLTINDLTNFCNKKTWGEVSQILTKSNWIYYDSEKGSTDELSIVTWSYSKELYSDEALGWLNLSTEEGEPIGVTYSFFNSRSYSMIQGSINSNGFKLIDNSIEDGEVISIYENKIFKLFISIIKRESSDWSDVSTTAYRISLIKKSSINDPSNGKKTDYYYGDVKMAEYSLLNGELNGELKAFHENGRLKKVGNYKSGNEYGLFREYREDGSLEVEYMTFGGKLNGFMKVYNSSGELKSIGNYKNDTEHGSFIEYDDYGNKNEEYSMLNGLKNGEYKLYEDGRISSSMSYKDDKLYGKYVEFIYDSKTGVLNFKMTGEYFDDAKNGQWKLVQYKDEKEHVLAYENYDGGIKNGDFKEVRGDSLIFGNYFNDEINGPYMVYLDMTKMLFGGIINGDSSEINLSVVGQYKKDQKTGFWKFYDLAESKVKEGSFIEDKKVGEWRYYHSNWSDENEKDASYSGELYLIENYTRGELNGESRRYSYLSKNRHLCAKNEQGYGEQDTCVTIDFEKIQEIIYYQNGKLHGLYELQDSMNKLITKGSYMYNSKHGEWIESFPLNDINNTLYYVYEKGNYNYNLREGKWVQYSDPEIIYATFNYLNGELHGEFVSLNEFNRPREIKVFEKGEFKKVTYFDSLGINITSTYDIRNETKENYKCIKTDYFETQIVSQEYRLKKSEGINHSWFEITFFLATNPSPTGEVVGFKDGDFKVLNNSKQPIVEGTYFKENRIGLWTYYYYDQGVKIETKFIDDKIGTEIYKLINGGLLNGTFIYFDEINGIKEVRKIKNGLRNGKMTSYDLKTNQVIKKTSYKDGVLK